MVEVDDISLPCSTEIPFKGGIRISKAKLREETEKHPEGWLGRLGLISILLSQEPRRMLGNSSGIPEELQRTGTDGRDVLFCGLLFFFKLLFGLC